MAKKMWAGRFEKELDTAANDFNSSISFDKRMYKQDIEGSIAHAEMLKDNKIIPAGDWDKIDSGLKGILADIESGSLEIDNNAEDIHMFVEQCLTERIGDAGKRLHTARSRNDQVATDIRLYLREECSVIQNDIKELAFTLVEKAENNLETVMPGYTHMQVAQPVTFAHHLMAYAQMFRRDYSRVEDCAKRINYSPLGSCALAGTSYPINRQQTAASLGFYAPCPNSMDAVSDRDFCVELLSCLSIVMTHLSRLCEEVIMWCSNEFAFVELDDAFSTGSSIMPQKKNPDIAELVRGKTGRVYGSLVSLLTMLKGLPLAYNKDMQEDKQMLFDAIDSTKACLKTISPMLETMVVKADNMKKAAAGGFINATDCADYLTKKGMPFRDSYKVTGELVGICAKRSIALEELKLEEFKEASSLFEEDIYNAIDLMTCVSVRKSEGGPAPQAVKKQIEEYKKNFN